MEAIEGIVFEMMNQLDQLANVFEESKEVVSKSDKRIVDLYHAIEAGHKNIHPMTLYKELQSVLRKRRVAKNNIDDWQALMSAGIPSMKARVRMRTTIKSRGTHRYKNKVYSSDLNELTKKTLKED